MTHEELLSEINKTLDYEGFYVASFGWIGLALRSIVELHKPIESNSELICEDCINNDYTPYPCDVIQIVEKELSEHMKYIEERNNRR